MRMGAAFIAFIVARSQGDAPGPEHAVWMTHIVRRCGSAHHHASVRRLAFWRACGFMTPGPSWMGEVASAYLLINTFTIATPPRSEVPPPFSS